MIVKITHKLHIASGLAPPCKIVRVDVTVVPIKLYNEIWPSETDGGHNRHSCLYSDGHVQRWQEAVAKKDFFSPPGAEVRVKTSNQPDCCATQRSLFHIRCLGHRWYQTPSQNWAILYNQSRYYVVFVLIILPQVLIIDSWCFDTQVYAFRSERI
jgi:hypothetical protein